MNMYLYTDIDIFKTRHQLFFLFVFWNEEGMGNLKKKKKKDSGKTLESSLGGHERLRAHQNWAWEPKSGSKTALKTTSLFDYWHLCNGNGPSNRWTCVTERRVLRWKTNLSGSSCLLLPFLSVSFFLQPLPLLLLCDGQFPDFFGWDGQRRSLHFSKFTLLPVSFPRACLGLTSQSSPVEWRLTPLSVDYII